MSESPFNYAVVYDPSAGFVTGGGWIDSPEGAYAPDPSLTGKANFGFVSKYQKGATTPTGQTQFQFKVADLNFHSNEYEWLVIVVAGARAKYKGSGTINGEGDYGFMVTAIDGQLNGGGGEDKFRIKIWDKSNEGVIVYDNQMDAEDTEDATTILGGGKVIIHDGGNHLLATDLAVGAGGTTLSQQTLALVVQEAISYWAGAGIGADRLAGLGQIDVRVADLSGSVLGSASSSDMIWIDRDAAGYGWGGPSDVYGTNVAGMDLLSVVTHEFGHKLGFDHVDAFNVMAPVLAPSTQGVVSPPRLDNPGFGVPSTQWHLPEPSRTIRFQDRFFESHALDNRKAARVESRLDDNIGTDTEGGMLYDWPLIVNPATPLPTESAAGATASAVDQGLLAWIPIGAIRLRIW